MASGQRRQILAHTAAALIFDWSPGAGFLTCVLANEPAEPLTDGIWVRPIDDATGWWRVPDSAVSYRPHRGALLKQLRVQRPAWSSDDQRFAFVARKHTPGDPTAKAAKDNAETNSIVCVKLSSRSASQLFASESPLRDLHWHPAGDRLGFVQNDEAPVVRIVRRLGATDGVAVSPPVSETGVRQFAGWNHDGMRLAYITPDVNSTQTGDHWAFLFPPIRDARGRVYVVDGDDGPGHVVHSGMRITFPQWSPREDTLSLWGTYSPTHGSWMSLFGLRSLRPGDPAAILDCGSGRMHWMAVNADEKVQVAHYYLLKRNFEEAWRWYEEAAEGREPAKPLELSDFARVARQLRTRRDGTFFEYVCLTKLGRQDEAAERLAQFRESTKIHLGDAIDAEEIDENGEQQLQRWATALAVLSRDFYIAEVYLSLDAVNDAVAFFRQQESLAETDYERLANSLCTSQLLLISGDHEAYVVQATDRLLPLVSAIHASLPSAPPPDEQSDLFQIGRNFERIFVVGLGAAALAPMFSADFLADIPDESLDRHIQSWLAAREQTDNGTAHLAIDLFLHAAYARRGMDELGESAAQRIRNNPAQQEWLDGKGVEQMDEMIEQARRFAW